MSQKSPCIPPTELRLQGTRTGKRASWAGPVARGLFAGLEIADRQAMRSRVMGERPKADPHREPSERLLEAWAPVDARLRELVSESIYAVWLSELHPHSRVGGVWKIGCTPRAVSWVRHRFGALLQKAAGDLLIVPCEGIQGKDTER